MKMVFSLRIVCSAILLLFFKCHFVKGYRKGKIVEEIFGNFKSIDEAFKIADLHIEDCADKEERKNLVVSSFLSRTSGNKRLLLDQYYEGIYISIFDRQ